MIQTEEYLGILKTRLEEKFGKRLVYIGLQGSYLRGEADENSDFDVMLVIDELSGDDLDAYRDILQSLGYFDISCGFVCGREDLAGWNPLEACHVLNTTKDIFGCLKSLLPDWTRQNVIDFVKLSVGNTFHELCHRRVHGRHENTVEALPGIYKGVFFILQNIHWLRTGEFVNSKAGLVEKLNGSDREVLDAAVTLKNAEEYDFEYYYNLIFSWCKAKLSESFDL